MSNIKERDFKKKEKIQDTSNDKYELIIINDDYNTFDKVIRCLIRYCGLAEGSAFIYTKRIHNEGSCVVLKDTKAVLEPICENLIDSGLNAKINPCDDK